jgi:aminopeptidase
MHDPRYDKLARILATHSTKLRAGDKVLIDAFDIPDEMTVSLIRAARAVGAVPLVQVHQARVTREMALQAQEEQLDCRQPFNSRRCERCSAYIAVRGAHNITKCPMSRRKK